MVFTTVLFILKKTNTVVNTMKYTDTHQQYTGWLDHSHILRLMMLDLLLYMTLSHNCTQCHF